MNIQRKRILGVISLGNVITISNSKLIMVINSITIFKHKNIKSLKMNSLKLFCFIAIIISILLLLNTNSEASLTKADHDTLIANLPIIADGGGWPKSWNVCNPILSNPLYNHNDWDEFFTEYFGNHKLTYHLRIYLGYHIFWWHNDNIHFELQEGLTIPLLKIIDSDLAHLPDSLGDILDTNSIYRETLYEGIIFIHDIVSLDPSVISVSTRILVDSTVINWIDIEYPSILKKNNQLNLNEQQYLTAMRGNLWMIIIDNFSLTASRKNYLCEIIGLASPYELLFHNYGFILVENNRFSNNQISVIDNFFKNLPPALFNLNMISCKDFLFAYGQQHYDIRARYGINVFGNEIGNIRSQDFPSDIEPKFTDAFLIVLAHEVNHNVDAYYISQYPDLLLRREQLLTQAGNDSLQYLRSMFAHDFFQNAPQEFIASIANQWFNSSFHTLQLGLSRFDRGFHEPINQVLYFCELYSIGSDTTRFYASDNSGNITLKLVPMKRDHNRNIVQLDVQGTIYDFDVDNPGNVLSYTKNNTGINTFPGEKQNKYFLSSNYPNPFNSETYIRYKIPGEKHVMLEVYNVIGQKVRTLVNKRQPKDSYLVKWNSKNDEGESLPSSVYILRMQAGQFVKTRKLLLCK